MQGLKRASAACIGMAAMAATCAVPAQPYPNKPIRVVTATAGSGSDAVARIVAQRLTESLGQPVIVDNRGGSALPGELVARAAPDGHTLLYYSSTLWLLGFMRDNVPYDTLRDFSPVSLTVALPNVLVVHPSLPVKTVKDLIALARSKPGELNYSSGQNGTPSHLAGELFNAMAGVRITRVPYKGAAPALTAVLSTEVHTMFGTTTNVPPHIKAGRLHALAVTTARSSERFPGLPTVAASGVPGYEIVSGYAFWAPAKTPVPVTSRLSAEIVRILRLPDVSEALLATGVDVIASTPEELAAYARSDMARMGKVIKSAGIRAE